MPVWPVIGNHDHNKNVPEDEHGSDLYSEYFGPADYAFNAGRDYYIVLDNIIYSGVNKYKEGLNSRQMEWRTLTIETIPLKHKVPTCGFLFTEHHRDKEPRKRYAYCSDTAYREQIVEQIAGVEVLFHEATYTEKDADKCKKHTHSTAKLEV